MKGLLLQDLGALLRLGQNPPEVLEEKLSSHTESGQLLTALVVGYACAACEDSRPGFSVPQLLSNSLLGRACAAAWKSDTNQREVDDEHGTRFCEAYPLVNRESLTQQHLWHPFEARCERSWKRHASLPGILASGLSGALLEMVDNVIQHSGESSSAPARGIAAYFATEKECGFVVMDSGRGALKSLRTNPVWQDLQSESDAITAVISKGATRKAENSFGDGYRSLFRTIVDHEFQVTLWSGEALTTIEADHGERREKSQIVEPLPGFAIGLSQNKKTA